MSREHVLLGRIANAEQWIKQLQTKNKKLKGLLANLYEAESIKYRDSCCPECDEEETAAIKKIRNEVKQYLKEIK